MPPRVSYTNEIPQNIMDAMQSMGYEQEPPPTDGGIINGQQGVGLQPSDPFAEAIISQNRSYDTQITGLSNNLTALRNAQASLINTPTPDTRTSDALALALVSALPLAIGYGRGGSAGMADAADPLYRAIPSAIKSFETDWQAKEQLRQQQIGSLAKQENDIRNDLLRTQLQQSDRLATGTMRQLENEDLNRRVEEGREFAKSQMEDRSSLQTASAEKRAGYKAISSHPSNAFPSYNESPQGQNAFRPLKYDKIKERVMSGDNSALYDLAPVSEATRKKVDERLTDTSALKGLGRDLIAEIEQFGTATGNPAARIIASIETRLKNMSKMGASQAGEEIAQLAGLVPKTDYNATKLASSLTQRINDSIKAGTVRNMIEDVKNMIDRAERDAYNELSVGEAASYVEYYPDGATPADVKKMNPNLSTEQIVAEAIRRREKKFSVQVIPLGKKTTNNPPVNAVRSSQPQVDWYNIAEKLSTRQDR